MKSAVLVSLLVWQALAAPTAKGPLEYVKEAVASSLPVQAIKALLPSGEYEEAPEATHELISLSEYPVWRVHHYNRLELKPVLDVQHTPAAELVPAVVAAEYAPPQEVLPLPLNPTATYYGDDEKVEMGRLGFLAPVLNVASGVREGVSQAVGNVKNFVTGFPKKVLGFIGLADEEVEEGIPAVPPISVASVSVAEPTKLPVHLPVLSAEHRKPPTYVVVNKIVPEVVRKSPAQLARAPTAGPVTVPKTIVVAEAPKKEALAAKENALVKKLQLVKPFVKPVTIPKPVVVKKPVDLKSVLVPASTIFVQEAPLLPTSYNNPEHVSAALNAPQQAAGVGGVASDVQNLPRLVQASVQALGNVNSIGQVADAIETYNELGGGISRSGSDSGFVPTAGFATKKVDADTIRRAQQKPEEPGHVAMSEPQRASAPEDFKPSPIDPNIILPAPSTTTTTTSTTTEAVVHDAEE